MKMKILTIYEYAKEKYQANHLSLKNFMERQKLVLHINKQKYYNIISILRYKWKMANKSLNRTKSLYKALHRTNSTSTLIDEEEIKDLLSFLKSSFNDYQKHESQNEKLKEELNYINNQISKTRSLINQFTFK